MQQDNNIYIQQNDNNLKHNTMETLDSLQNEMAGVIPTETNIAPTYATKSLESASEDMTNTTGDAVNKNLGLQQNVDSIASQIKQANDAVVSLQKNLAGARANIDPITAKIASEWTAYNMCKERNADNAEYKGSGHRWKSCGENGYGISINNPDKYKSGVGKIKMSNPNNMLSADHDAWAAAIHQSEAILKDDQDIVATNQAKIDKINNVDIPALQDALTKAQALLDEANMSPDDKANFQTKILAAQAAAEAVKTKAQTDAAVSLKASQTSSTTKKVLVFGLIGIALIVGSIFLFKGKKKVVVIPTPTA